MILASENIIMGDIEKLGTRSHVATRRVTLAAGVLVSAAGWWLGVVPGVLCSVLVVSGLAVARRADGPLHPLPLWQVLLVPVLSLPIGIGLGVLAFILGPGF